MNWRQHVDALHVTLFGLVKPDDYHSSQWPLNRNRLADVREIVSQHDPVRLEFQGFGMLLWGVVAVRCSDCDNWVQIRDKCEDLTWTSKMKPGEHCPKIVLGRLEPAEYSSDKLKALQEAINQTRELEAFSGEIQPENLELIHYKDDFLDDVYHRLQLPHTTR